MFLKRIILWYGMVWYPMLCYHMLWNGMESMVCYEISMLCYEISMLCYVMVYVVKDKHSATVTYVSKEWIDKIFGGGVYVQS